MMRLVNCIVIEFRYYMVMSSKLFWDVVCYMVLLIGGVFGDLNRVSGVYIVVVVVYIR